MLGAAESRNPRQPGGRPQLDAAREAVVADLLERVGGAEPRADQRRAR